MKNSDIKRGKELLLVTGSINTYKVLAAQLRKYLGQDFVIHPYTVDAPTETIKGSHFTVFSSEEVYDDFIALGNKPFLDKYVISKRTIFHDSLDKILLLPRDQDILLVNDSYRCSKDCIDFLIKLGFDYLKYIPYYPGCEYDISKVSFAITPGEIDKVPRGITSVYDIGVRVMDLATLIKILNHFNMLYKNINEFSDLYTKSLVAFARRISNVANETNALIRTVRPEIIGRGYYAKYHFVDIIGESPNILKTKAIAEKIAHTELSILIEGENGTGKELFASAIHNSSERFKNPFVAINFSALPDELIESELFGYEEGSFTGAKKGGKIGLFQQANGGTIFLDEIGDISPKMQAKLLRVIQEREIMKVGGDRIIPIDVRIIAATNRNLKEMISEGHFRKDLYYRLKEGYIHLPSLANRKSDIPLLIKHWLSTSKFKETFIDEEVMSVLVRQNWPGNVRELLNTIKFAMAVNDDGHITLSDLPYDNSIEQSPEIYEDYSPYHGLSENKLDDLSIEILLSIERLNHSGFIAGRNKIQQVLSSSGLAVSEYKLRKTLSTLQESGYIKKSHGHYGLELTDTVHNLTYIKADA